LINNLLIKNPKNNQIIFDVKIQKVKIKVIVRKFNDRTFCSTTRGFVPIEITPIVAAHNLGFII
jgi:hypothetical protein